MAKTDWEAMGDGDISIVEELGSKRCHLIGLKQLLYSGRDDLVDCRVQCELRFDVGSADVYAGLFLRSNQILTNYYLLTILPSSTTVLYIAINKIVDGNLSTLVQANIPVVPTEYSKWRFEIEGAVLTAKRREESGWEPILQTEDNTHASGYVGFGSYSIVPRWCRFDNIEIFEKV